MGVATGDVASGDAASGDSGEHGWMGIGQ